MTGKRYKGGIKPIAQKGIKVLARYRVAGKGKREVNVGQLQSCYILSLSLLAIGGRRPP
jgi:hypothetical protein